MVEWRTARLIVLLILLMAVVVLAAGVTHVGVPAFLRNLIPALQEAPAPAEPMPTPGRVEGTISPAPGVQRVFPIVTITPTVSVFETPR